VDVPALRLAFYRARHRAHGRDIFYGTILREYCEKNYSLGYELFKRMAPVMLRRLQAARKQMLAIHAHGATLEPVVLDSPFMDQETGTD
jgi:hypothetical protein